MKSELNMCFLGIDLGIKDNPYDEVTWGKDEISNLGLNDLMIQ